jgi:hypothetical protein
VQVPTVSICSSSQLLVSASVIPFAVARLGFCILSVRSYRWEFLFDSQIVVSAPVVPFVVPRLGFCILIVWSYRRGLLFHSQLSVSAVLSPSPVALSYCVVECQVVWTLFQCVALHVNNLYTICISSVLLCFYSLDSHPCDCIPS